MRRKLGGYILALSHFASATALATSLLAPGLLWSASASAQASSQATSQDSATIEPSDKESSEEKEVVVVGTHIRRNTFNTADSIQLITRDDATQAGFSSAAGVLQSTAVTGGTSQINNSYGGFVTAGGPGANTVSLRGLGTTRTLILLNGRRLAPAGSRGQVGAADLNVLPSAIVNRYEILNTGASSIYGSDAVAGVINIVTEPKVKGITLEAQHNINQEGGGFEQRYSAVFGTSGDRFSILGSLEYYNREEVTFGQRDWATCQTQNRKTSGTAAIGSADFIDPATGKAKCYTTGVTGESGVTVNTLGTVNYAGNTVALAPGVPAGYSGVCNRFRPNAAVKTGALPGYECVGGGTLNINVRDTFPQSILGNSLVSPGKTYTGFVSGSYDIGMLGNAKVYAELLVNRRKSEQNSNRQFTIDYRQGSPLLPANLQNNVFLGPQPGGITGTSNIAARVFADYGNYNNRQSVDFVKGVIGIKGELPYDFHYDAYVQKSWSDASYTTDLLLIDRLTRSLDVVASGTGFVCRDASGGCVAAPALSAAVIGGQLPQAWRDYVTVPVTGTTKFRETIASVVIDGPLFSLWADPVQVALGFEHRSNSIDDTPDLNSSSNNLYGFTSSSPTRGSDEVNEVYGEIEVPIVKQQPFFHSLSLNGSARYTNYRSYGGQTTFKVGGLWEPTDFVGLRGSYGTSYRAPALFEQYLGSTSGFQSNAGDPCNDYTSKDKNLPLYKNCLAEGLPTGFTATSSIQVNQLGGAASGLKAETSKAFTAGVVLQPKLGSFGRLSLSADYFNIKVENGVSQLSYSTILSQCYNAVDFRANSICNYAKRGTTAPFGLTVTTGYVNISTSKVSGWDLNAKYDVPLGKGNFQFTAAVTKFDERFSQTLPTDQIFDNVGTLNNPDWTGTFTAKYAINNFQFRYGLDWINGTYGSADYIGVTQAVRDTYVFETPSYFLHSMAVQIRTAQEFSFIVGVRNLFNTAPPIISSGAYNRVGNASLYSGYDYNGRQFYVNVSKHF
jgi:outer membrane receptor protein involved in Fe transport